jgi:hypothetical protein
MRLSAGRCARQFDGHDVFERTKQVLGGAAAMRAMHGACSRRGAVRGRHGGTVDPSASAGDPKKIGWFIERRMNCLFITAGGRKVRTF